MEYGIQLFSVRRYLRKEENFAPVFERIHDLGVKVVQKSGVFDIAAEKLKKIADDNEIKVVCTHTPFDKICNDLEKVAEEHIILGADTVGISMMPSEYRENHYDKFLEFTDICNNISEKLKKYNLQLGYHNHWFEYERFLNTTIYKYLIENCKDMVFILDTFWLYAAKENIADYLIQLEGRIPHVHFKDYKKILGLMPVFTEVGYGNIDFISLIPLFEKAGTKNALIEIDFAFNPWKSLSKSLSYLQNV